MDKLLALELKFYPDTGLKLPGPLGPGGPNSPYLLSRVLSIMVGILTVVAAIWFLFKLISGGVAIISSGGDKGKLANARGDITYGLVGLLIVVTATVFISFVLELLGIANILNLTEAIDILAP